jgi:pimeloyl-ACP methyl ester carboxylesterase
MEPRERRFDLPSRGGAMAALDFGSPDRPVDLVFSHANGFNARTYRTILAPLAGEYRVLAVDMRGHGRTDLPTPVELRRSWDDLKADLLALFEAAGIDHPVVLAGHSMGATVSLLTAAEATATTRALVLFEPVILPPGVEGVPEEAPLAQGALRRRPAFASREEAMGAYTGRGAFKTWPADILADYVQDAFRDQPDGSVTLAATPAWEFSNFTRQAHDSLEALRHVVCPTRIFKAEHNSTCRLDPTAVAGLSNVEIESCAGASHFLPMERPELIRTALIAALEGAGR